MSSFNRGLAIEKTGRREWTTTRRIVYHVGSLESRWAIVIPKGFKTDGASVPRLLWWLFPPFGGDYDQAAVLHDFLYRTAFLNLERVVADAILLEAMVVLRTGALARWSIFVGVRAGGWVTYRKYRRLEAAKAMIAGQKEQDASQP
jgi:hypothetical protein